MKQTAVEWLYEKLEYINWMRNRDEISSGMADEWRKHYLDQAKAMEKEQMNNAYNDDRPNLTIYESNEAFEQYYNETFKSENIVMFMTPENGEIESIILTDNPDCGVKGITFKSE